MDGRNDTGTGSARILKAIADLPSALTNMQAGVRAVLTHGLSVLQEVTASPGGAIGEVRRDEDGPAVFTLTTVSGAAGDAARRHIRRAAEEHGLDRGHDGGSETYTIERPVRRPAEPSAEPSVFALPLVYGGETIALAVLTGREGGYEAGLAGDLAPLAAALAAMAAAERARAEHAELAHAAQHPDAQDWDLETGTRALAARHAGIGPVEIDLAARVMRGDESLGQLIGAPGLREISFDRALAILHPDDRAAVEARLSALIEGAADRFDTGHRIIRPDGEVVWAKTVTMVTRRDESGAPLVLSGVVIDETACRNTERELVAAKERYDLAVGGSHIAIWDQNLVTGEVYWSPRMGEILGLGFKEGHEDAATFAARIHPEDRAATDRSFHALVTDDTPYDVVLRILRTDGGHVHVRSRGGVLRDDTGRAVRVSGSLRDISAEVMARARADLALEEARLGIWDWDLRSGLMTADQRFADILGRPWLAGHPAPAQQPTRYIHAEDRAQAHAKLTDLEAGRIDRVEFEHRVIRPDGAVAWVGGCVSVVETGTHGRPNRVIGVFEDRTERKNVEMEIAAAKQRYDLAVTGAHTAIWDHDIAAGELYWSARLGEILGLGAEERTERVDDFIDRIHPADRERARIETRTTIDLGVPLDLTMRVRRADGAYRHLRSRAGVLRDEAGRAARLCGSITDVTEEIESEAKARLAGRRAQLALQAAHLGVWEFDAASGLVTADPVLAEMLGAPEIAGRTQPLDDIQAFTHPDDLAQVRADLAKLYTKSLSSIGNEHRIVRADGAEVWVRADVGVAERGADGKVGRLIGIVQDLTGVKRSEELLRCTADAARKANEAKSQFLATMSHEIRTPLNGVLGVVQLLELTDLDARQQRYVDIIKASGRSLGDVIEDVLDISRIEAGKLELKPEPVRIADILDQAAAPSSALAVRKGVELSLTVSGDLAEPVLVDGRRVAQMAANLIGNAVKFTDRGSVRVRASRPDRALLRIEVDDDGPGLPEDMHEAVFERFTQADMSHSRAHEGSGLGLAIVRELAQLAGGVAGVRSSPGHGACFWIELPAPAAMVESRPPAEIGAAESVSGAAPLRVLVVEDHPVNRAVTAELVSQAGHVCETADCGEEALASLRVRPIDLVLLDLHMPGMDGAATLSHIRSGEAGPRDMPVHVLSADATPEARAKAERLGADGFFVKPIDAEALRRVLASVPHGKREAG